MCRFYFPKNEVLTFCLVLKLNFFELTEWKYGVLGSFLLHFTIFSGTVAQLEVSVKSVALQYIIFHFLND